MTAKRTRKVSHKKPLPSSTYNTAVYARTSKEEEQSETSEPRLSIETQIKNAKKKARQKEHKLKIHDDYIFQDRGISGEVWPNCWQEKPPEISRRRGRKRLARSKLSRIIELVEQGRIKNIIIRKKDRLARDLELSLKLYKFFDLHDVQLIATDETMLDTKYNPSDRLILYILIIIAQYELDNIKKLIKASKQTAKEQGLKLGPTYTFGYKDGKEKRTVVVDKEREPIVIEIFEMFVKKKMSIAEIVRYCNEHYHGLRPYKKHSRQWYQSSIKRKDI